MSSCYYYYYPLLITNAVRYTGSAWTTNGTEVKRKCLLILGFHRYSVYRKSHIRAYDDCIAQILLRVLKGNVMVHLFVRVYNKTVYQHQYFIQK